MAFHSFNLNLPNAEGELTVEIGRSRIEGTKGLFFYLKHMAREPLLNQWFSTKKMQPDPVFYLYFQCNELT